MYTLQAIRTNLARLIGEAANAAVTPEEIVAPPKLDMGDLAFGCFRLAKDKGLSPTDFAKELAKKIDRGDQTIKTIEAQGPYINIKLRRPVFISRVVHEIEQFEEKYGATEEGHNRQVMLEYANLNTHKEFHVGHLRNILYGLSLNRLMDFSGWQTIPVSYINDMGSMVAKCLWLFVRQGSQNIKQEAPKEKRGKKTVPFVVMPDDLWASAVVHHLTLPRVKRMISNIPADQRTGKYLGNIYAEATKLIEENKEWKEELSYVQNMLENRDPAWFYLWQETRRWSMRELYKYLQDFGVVIKRQYLESEFIDQSKQIVQTLLDKGIAIESQGAIIIDLDAYPDPEIQKQKLGVFMLRKSDGNLLYATKDIPLAQQKFTDYPDLYSSIIVVDVRQSLYFRQLFAVLKIMGYTKPLKHLGYEFVTLPEGAMSSRKGTVITLQDFIAYGLEQARAQIVKRHEDWNEGKIEHTAWCIAMGGIIFTMLKQDPERPIVFDMQKALAFEGDTGPYVQYSITRLTSILNKAAKEKIDFSQADTTVLDHDAEHKLILCLSLLPDICAQAAKVHKPSVLAQWCLEAAASINEFYRDVPVMEAPADIRAARLKVIVAARQALSNALWCLGIPVPDAM